MVVSYVLHRHLLFRESTDCQSISLHRRILQRTLNQLALWALASLLLWPVSPHPAQAAGQVDGPTGGQNYYLPMIAGPAQSTNTANGPRINLPVFPVTGAADPYFNQAALFWFGQVGPSSSYVDVRIAGTQTELAVYVSVFDRLLWYNTQSSQQNLTQWDSATFYVGQPTARCNLDSSAYALTPVTV